MSSPQAAPTDQADQPSESRREKIEAAEAFLGGVMRHLGAQTVVSGGVGDEHELRLDVEGTDAEALFFLDSGQPNRHLVDALQHLVRVVVFGPEGRRPPVVIDSGGYARRRQHALERMADRLSEAAGGSASLELHGMHPRDRRVVHHRLGSHDEVETTSVGFGLFRRLRVEGRS